MTQADCLADMVVALVNARTSYEGVPMADIKRLARMVHSEVSLATVVDNTDAPSIMFGFPDGSTVMYELDADDDDE